jgi:hypothetical protein
MASLLYAAIEVSEEDSDKVGRGEKIGYSYGNVTDLNTGKIYAVFQANCGADNCNCAVTVEEQ